MGLDLRAEPPQIKICGVGNTPPPSGVFLIQSTPDNSNLQGKSKKGSSYRELEENSRE